MLLVVGAIAVIASAGCCGGGPNHKCDFTPATQPGADGGADAAIPCGTAICEAGDICCFKKAGPIALCINPADFESLGCDKPSLDCAAPADCPGGTTCCFDGRDWTVSCQPRQLCPEDGDTRLVCASQADCPTTSPACSELGSAEGVALKVCVR